MATGEDIIKRALRKIGVLAAGVTPKYDMANDALEECNDMLASWANQGKLIYQIYNEEFSLSASTQDYTIGDGGDFDTDWPTIIESIKIRTSENYDYDMKELTNEQWMNIRDKSVETDIPRNWNYNRAHPLGTIKFYPIPSGTVTALIASWKQFTALTLTGTVTLPPGYKEHLVLQLAMRLAPDYEKPISRDLKHLAWEAEQGIKGVNKKDTVRKVDSALLSGKGGTFDIYTGTYL